MNSMILPRTSHQQAAPNALENARPESPPSSPYRKPRRAACDRCRHQKLKCAREERRGNSPEAEKCNRCTAQRVPCSFSTSRRAGRASVTRLSSSRSPTEQGQHAGAANTLTGMTSQQDTRTEGSHSGWHPCHWSTNAAESQSSISQNEQDIASLDERSNSNKLPASAHAFVEEAKYLSSTLFASLQNEPNASGLEPHPMPNMWGYPWSDLNNAGSMDKNLSALVNDGLEQQRMVLQNLNANFEIPCPQNVSQPLSTSANMALPFDKDSEPARIPSSEMSVGDGEVFPYSHTFPSSNQWSESSASSVTPGQLLATIPHNSSGSMEPSDKACDPAEAELRSMRRLPQSNIETQLQRLNQLSDLNMKLYHQLTNINAQSHTRETEFSNLSSALVGNILESSTRLQDILKAFDPPNASTVTAPPNAQPVMLTDTSPPTPWACQSVPTPPDFGDSTVTLNSHQNFPLPSFSDSMRHT